MLSWIPEISALSRTDFTFRNIFSVSWDSRKEGADSLHRIPFEAAASTEVFQTCGMTFGHFWSLGKILPLAWPVASWLVRGNDCNNSELSSKPPSEFSFLSSWGWLVRSQLPPNHDAWEHLQGLAIHSTLSKSLIEYCISHSLCLRWIGLPCTNSSKSAPSFHVYWTEC